MGRSLIIGIDPGNNGAVVGVRGSEVLRIVKYDRGEQAVADALSELQALATPADPGVAYLERVWGMGHDGSGGSFKFGQSYGYVRGLLRAYRIDIIDVLPKKWMTAMNVPPIKGDKARHRQEMVRMAQQFLDSSGERLVATNWNAAAILIANYGREEEGR